MSRAPAICLLAALALTPTIPTVAAAVPVASPTTPRAPSVTDLPGTVNDTFTVWSTPGVDWYLNGTLLDPTTYDRPQRIGDLSSLVIEAKAQPGYSFPPGTMTMWTLGIKPPPSVGPVSVGHKIVGTAEVPTAKVTWSADGATAYDVTYRDVRHDGTYGPELSWFKDTTATSANFVMGPTGGVYSVSVVAKDPAGNRSQPASTLVQILVDPHNVDIGAGVGTFAGPWLHLNVAPKLPYYAGTAALGYRNASWTVTLPAGTRGLELYATVHAWGAHGKIVVNGRNWADFDTNTRYWGAVRDPYMYPVRRIQGWDSSRPVTITVAVADTGSNYLALDAYQLR